MPNVFVSHIHRDAEAVIDIARRLQEAGARPWLYTSGIEHLAPIIVWVREALRQCRGLLVFVSVASLGSFWVRKKFGLPLDELSVRVDQVLVVFDGNDEDLVAQLGVSDR